MMYKSTRYTLVVLVMVVALAAISPAAAQGRQPSPYIDFEAFKPDTPAAAINVMGITFASDGPPGTPDASILATQDYGVIHVFMSDHVLSIPVAIRVQFPQTAAWYQFGFANGLVAEDQRPCLVHGFLNGELVFVDEHWPDAYATSGEWEGRAVTPRGEGVLFDELMIMTSVERGTLIDNLTVNYTGR